MSRYTSLASAVVALTTILGITPLTAAVDHHDGKLHMLKGLKKEKIQEIYFDRCMNCRMQDQSGETSFCLLDNACRIASNCDNTMCDPNGHYGAKDPSLGDLANWCSRPGDNYGGGHNITQGCSAAAQALTEKVYPKLKAVYAVVWMILLCPFLCCSCCIAGIAFYCYRRHKNKQFVYATTVQNEDGDQAGNDQDQMQQQRGAVDTPVIGTVINNVTETAQGAAAVTPNVADADDTQPKEGPLPVPSPATH